MAMNVGGPGGSGEPEVMVEINTTPLIDVMLVLLIMLIITIPIQLHAVNLNLPVAKAAPETVKPEVVQVDIDAQSRVHWQGLPVDSPAELDAKMRAAGAMTPQPDIHLRPDKDARYEVVASVLAATKRLGLTRIAVTGNEQFAR